jgi:hypothetical protein
MSGQDQQRGSAAKAAAQATEDSASPEPAAESAPDSAAGAPSDDARDEETADPGDDVRRKFRESLQRKQKHQSEHRSAEGGKGGSKVHDGFGPMTGRRSFRRKSGS